MAPFKVKVLNKDNRFGGRIIDISIGSSSFKTPIRTATHKEYYAAGSLPHKITIKSPISEYVSSFGNFSLDAFLTENGSFPRRSARMRDQSLDMMRLFPIISSIQIPQGRRIAQEKLLLFKEFQKDPQFGIVSIPPFEYNNIEEYKTVITQFNDAVKSRGQEAMPILPISTKLAKFKLEFAALRQLKNDINICNVIGFAYADPLTHIQQFQEIYENREEDIWYHAFGIPRIPRSGKSPIAHIHELQNWGLDTFSSLVKYMSPKSTGHFIKEAKTIKPDEVKCRRFDAQTLGILKEPDWIARYKNDIRCDCPICNGKDLLTFKEEYTHDLAGNFDPKLLFGADKVHDLVSGSNEFNVSMDAIKSDDLPTYYNEKEFTKNRKLIKYLKSPSQGV
jgi:hypothetical protein